MTELEAIEILRRNREEQEDLILAEAVAIKALKKFELEENDLGMFCFGCRRGVHQHIYNADGKPFEVKYCPFCGEKLEWK